MTLLTRPITPKSPRLRFRWLARMRRAIAPWAARLGNPAPLYLRIWLVAVVLVGLLSLLAMALSILGAGVNLRGLEQHRSDEDSAKLNASSIAQSFRSPRANLAEIDVELGSFVNLTSTGQVRLLSGDGLGGPLVYQAPLTAASWAKNPFLAINFPPIAASEGVTYTLVLETPGRPLNTSLGARYNTFDALSSGSMYIGGEAAPGDISIEAWYHYDIPTLVSDVGRALTGQGVLIISWLAFLVLPGLALLLWLPNSLSVGQRVVAAPGLSALAFPVFLLVTRAVGLKLNGVTMWLLILICAAAIALWLARNNSTPKTMPSNEVKGQNHALERSEGSKLEDLAFWGLLAGVTFITLSARLLSLRDALAGMGLDAYHHTLIAEMFVQNGGIPQNYLPYAPIASFTYHYGFHAMTAAVAWLSGHTSATDMLPLMPQAGQIAITLPVLTLTLFGWKVLGDRWAGLMAGALAGMVSIIPAFYVNWGRYTQGMGLALLPVAWVLLLEALAPASLMPAQSVPLPGQVRWVPWQAVARQSGPLMLAVIGAAGLALTHYRIAMIYAGFVALYLVWRVVRALRARNTMWETGRPVWRAALVGALTIAAWLPWLLNLAHNFGTRFVGKNTPIGAGYYSLRGMVGDPLLNHPSLSLMFALSFGGLVWARRRGDILPMLPAFTWLILGLWSNPYLLDPITEWLGIEKIRLPYAGYLDATTLATGAWIPLALLAGYTLSQLGRWILSLGSGYAGLWGRAWRVVAPAMLGLVVLLGGGATGLLLAPLIDDKPYIAQADLEALTWMRDNLPHDAYVLANPFAFPWDSPPQAVQGSDAGLWVPLMTGGIRSSVPPIPTYNERLLDPNYVNKIRDIIGWEPFGEDQPADWGSLKDADPPVLDPKNPPHPGVTHIYVGSRGGALNVAALLNSDAVRLLFHKDAVWVFEIK